MDSRSYRTGFGWDLHRLVSGRPLLIGGVVIPHELGEDGWSDGDVLLHAVIDALLGAAGAGDIGERFPPGDPLYRGLASGRLLEETLRLVSRAGWRPVNLDCVVVLERPKLLPHKPAIRASLAGLLGLSEEAVSIKAKTKEGVDAVGEGRAVEAWASVLIERRGDAG